MVGNGNNEAIIKQAVQGLNSSVIFSGMKGFTFISLTKLLINADKSDGTSIFTLFMNFTIQNPLAIHIFKKRKKPGEAEIFLMDL